MSRRKATTYADVHYSRIGDTTDGPNENQFTCAPTIPIPWRALGLAALLFVAGTTMLTISCLIFSGAIDTKYGDRMWPFLILGSLMFIPGAYHMRIAYYAYRQVPGYSFQDIPEFD